MTPRNIARMNSPGRANPLITVTNAASADPDTKTTTTAAGATAA